MSKEEYARKTAPPVLTYQAHSAPIGMTFYTDDHFPERYRQGAFIALRGSWNRYPPTGYKIVFLRFENGKPVEFEDFVSGFLLDDGKTHFGRLAGVAVDREGALLFTDDSNGVMYRVTYSK
jgi:glucose/arabinose dehydrogenase